LLLVSCPARSRQNSNCHGERSEEPVYRNSQRTRSFPFGLAQGQGDKSNLGRAFPEPDTSFQVSGFDRAWSPPGGFLFSSGATVRAEQGRVNTIRIVQRWNSRSRIGCDESGSSFGRGQLRLAYERRGLSGGREIALYAVALGDPNLHNGCTGLEQLPFASTQWVRSNCGSEVLDRQVRRTLPRRFAAMATAAELCSAWTLRLRSGQARGDARPSTV